MKDNAGGEDWKRNKQKLQMDICQRSSNHSTWEESKKQQSGCYCSTLLPSSSKQWYCNQCLTFWLFLKSLHFLRCRMLTSCASTNSKYSSMTLKLLEKCKYSKNTTQISLLSPRLNTFPMEKQKNSTMNSVKRSVEPVELHPEWLPPIWAHTTLDDVWDFRFFFQSDCWSWHSFHQSWLDFCLMNLRQRK